MMRRTPLRRVAEKRAEQIAEYKLIRANFLVQNPFCQMKWENGNRSCFNRSLQVHHKKGCGGKLLTDVRYFMAVCPHCHSYIEHHKKEMRRIGVILYR